MRVKIHVRGVVEVDLPDSVCLDASKSNRWRLSYSDDETKSINDAIRNYLHAATIEHDRVHSGTQTLMYHSLFGGREYPRMPKE